MRPAGDAHNWIIAPVLRAILYVGEEMKISGTLIKSLIILNRHETLLKIAREKLILNHKTQGLPEIDRLLAAAPGLKQTAVELIQNDYSVINIHSLVSMWSAVEVAIEDTVVLFLIKEASALKLLANAGVKTASFEPGPILHEDARRLFSRIERKLREKLKIGEFYIELFNLLGIKLNYSCHLLSKMEEINNVRNCLMHRGGIIDARAAQSVAALRPFLGKQMPITEARYLEYYDVITSFLQEMLKGLIASSHIQAGKQ